MLSARSQHLLFQTLCAISYAVIAVWFVLWLMALFRPDFVDVSNKRTIPWLAGAVLGVMVFGHLARRSKAKSPPPAS
jgi:hypothetical protein